MACLISAKMHPDKCRQLRNANNLACRGCEGAPTRKIIVELPAEIYEAIQADCKPRGVAVEDAITDLLTDAASGEFVMMRR